MNAQHRASVADMYQTDLERYLFAPAPRRSRPRATPRLGTVRDWMNEWWASGWPRWKAVMAQAMSL